MPEADNIMDARIKKLEDNYSNVLSILQRIEKRLLGDLEKDTSGLIYEVKQLREQQLVNISEISKALTKIDAIEKQLRNQEGFLVEFEKLKNTIFNYNKNKWMMMGALVAVGILVGKIDWIWRLFIP